jgi:3-phytase
VAVSPNRELTMSHGLLLCLAAFAADLPAKPPGSIRVATFNASLNRDAPGKLILDLSRPGDPQARNVAEIIQRVAPDVLLINEFDHDSRGEAAERFQRHYLAVSQNGAPAIEYPHRYSAEVNTGVPSGHDLNGDGKVVNDPDVRGYGEDAIGFGLFPGQYGMVIYSKYPIDRDRVRRLDAFLWKDMPDALLPRKEDGAPWYTDGALGVLRLSSKGHWDVPIRVDDRVVHLLASHPTPPAFDGPEDRNGRRNHDEIRLWSDYLTGGEAAAYLNVGEPPATFLILGDQNADPIDGGSVAGAIDQLLKHPKVNAAFIPSSDGGPRAAALQGQANDDQSADPAHDTADFADPSVGNLRVDYVLPSRDLKVLDGGVFWPPAGDPLARLVEMGPPAASSDHRLVWLDVVPTTEPSR